MKIEIKLNQEQFDLLLASLVQVAQGVHKLSDAWEGKGKETDIVGDIFENNPIVSKNDKRKKGWTKYPGYISRDAIYQRLGGHGNYIAFDAACAKCKVTDIITNKHKKYIPLKYADDVVATMKKIMNLS